MAIYKIKAEDKAALLNRLEKLNVNISSNDLKNKSSFQNGTVVNYFELSVNDPEQEEKINSILNHSPAINQISEMETKKKKMTKDELKEMVRQELQAVLAEKKKVKDEDKKEKIDENEDVNESLLADAAPILATLLGVGGTLAVSIVNDLRKAKTPEEKKQVLQSLASQISKSKGIDN
jgi:hypothetical protein